MLNIRSFQSLFLHSPMLRAHLFINTCFFVVQSDDMPHMLKLFLKFLLLIVSSDLFLNAIDKSINIMIAKKYLRD